MTAAFLTASRISSSRRFLRRNYKLGILCWETSLDSQCKQILGLFHDKPGNLDHLTLTGLHYTDPHNPSVDIIFPGRCVREWDVKCKCHIFSQTYAKISTYSLKKEVWNNLDEKQSSKAQNYEALPNRHQICSKSEIRKAIFEHLNRWMNYGSHSVGANGTFQMLPERHLRWLVHKEN